MLWLAALAHEIDVGWISILDRAHVLELLNVPKDWSLIAYLCVGHPQDVHINTELERVGWQEQINIKIYI